MEMRLIDKTNAVVIATVRTSRYKLLPHASDRIAVRDTLGYVDHQIEVITYCLFIRDLLCRQTNTAR
jgi:hypothetical protein